MITLGGGEGGEGEGGGGRRWERMKRRVDVAVDQADHGRRDLPFVVLSSSTRAVSATVAL